MLVEGQTERTFATRVLAPHLAQQGVFLTPTLVTTRQNPAGPDSKGGLVSYPNLLRQLNNLLGDSGAYTTTFFDLYGLGGRQEGETADAFEARLLAGVGHGQNRFLPYIQQYEFETLLFAAPDETAEELSAPNQAQEMRKIIAQCGGVETINDGPATAPSKRIAQLFPNYDKVVDGPDILSRSDLKRLCNKESCPRFVNWLTALEGLAPCPEETVRLYQERYPSP